ncbi:MAG: OmpH family outer membrane protein [Verrucomicrobiota bacterium]
MKLHTTTLFTLLTLAIAGCGPAPSPAPAPTPPPTPAPAKGGAAIIDLDAAAKRLGREAAILAELREAGAQLKDQLTASQKDYQEQIDHLKTSLGSKPSEADKQKLAELARSLNQQFQQKQQQAQQELNTKRGALIGRFREEIKPVALNIATSKGLGIVQIRNDITILANDPGLDITDEVVAEVSRAASASSSPAPSPNP